MEKSHSYYLEEAFDVRYTVRKAVQKLKPIRTEFDVIVVTGVSGLLIGPIVAYRLNKKLLVIRKESDFKNSHCSQLVEGWLPSNGGRWLFLDDFIDSGKSLNRVYEALDKVIKNHVFCGFYGYRYNKFESGEELKRLVGGRP